MAQAKKTKISMTAKGAIDELKLLIKEKSDRDPVLYLLTLVCNADSGMMRKAQRLLAVLDVVDQLPRKQYDHEIDVLLDFIES